MMSKITDLKLVELVDNIKLGEPPEDPDKIIKMEDCGITIAKSPAEIGKTLLNKLSN